MRASELRDLLGRPCVHGECADLRGARITDPLDLSDMTICGFDLSSARFEGPVIARNAHFAGLSWFAGATIDQEVDFSGSQFDNDAKFEAATFAGQASFAKAEFRGIAKFDKAEFQTRADMTGMTCFGNLSFDVTEFAKGVDLSETECLGGFWGNDTHFTRHSEFRETEVHGRLWLKNAREGDGPLKGSRFGMSFGYTYK